MEETTTVSSRKHYCLTITCGGFKLCDHDPTMGAPITFGVGAVTILIHTPLYFRTLHEHSLMGRQLEVTSESDCKTTALAKILIFELHYS